jgi:hypothetical protein
MSYLRCLYLFVGGCMSYLRCLYLFVGRLMSYLRCLYLFVYIGVQHILKLLFPACSVCDLYLLLSITPYM